MLRIDYPKSQGINVVGWLVSISNILLLICYYYIAMAQQIPVPNQVITYLSMAAVFPEDFFHTYLRDLWFAHFCWMLLMVIAAFGVLLLNALARKIFIVLCIVHAVVLCYLFVLHQSGPEFFGYFFKLYFNCAFIFAYVGFITIPEVRVQFISRHASRQFRWWFSKSPSRHPASQDAQGYYNLALAYSRLQRNADAIASLQKAIQINPKDDRYHYELGKLFFLQRNSSAAIPALKEAVRINPNHFQAIYQLGQIYQQEGCGRETVMTLEKASHLQPHNSQVFRQLGKAHMLLEDYPAAVRSLQKSIELNSRDPEAYYQLGWIFLNKIGDYEEAREALRTAVHLKADMLDAHFQLGMTCLRLNRYKDALRAFKEVVYREEEHKQAHYQMGFVYLMLKDVDSALRECQIVRGLDPDLAEKLSLLISSQNSKNSPG